MHDVVINQRHRLRCVRAEVGIAVAADIEAREGAAKRRFDVQAGHAARQHADVLAAGVQHVELFAGHGGNGAGHVLDVLGAALGGHGDGLQRPSRGGGSGLSGLCHGESGGPQQCHADQYRCRFKRGIHGDFFGVERTLIIGFVRESRGSMGVNPVNCVNSVVRTAHMQPRG